jgi:Ni,Fe-hydrogenase I cytochrome b subunit
MVEKSQFSFFLFCVLVLRIFLCFLGKKKKPKKTFFLFLGQKTKKNIFRELRASFDKKKTENKKTWWTQFSKKNSTYD